MNFGLINWFTRCFYVLSMFIVYLINVKVLFIYIPIFFVSIEVLLLKKSWTETKKFKISQLLFTVFVSYVLVARATILGFSKETNYNLNTIEHILFALVICLMLFYYILFYGNKKKSPSILVISILFNFIGLINEFFQNYYQGKPVFILEDSSIKDLIANILGTLLFLCLVSIFKIKFTNPANHH